MSNNNNKLQSSRLIFEELEERRLFSGGIEGLIGTDLDSDEQAIYADLDTSKTRTAEADENTSASTAEQQSQEIVLVDAGVDNYQQLVDDLLENSDSSRNIEVVVLERDQDGIEQISSVLQQRDDLDAIHIISHGSDGNIELGNTSLNDETLQENNLGIALWANAFAETGDILIYGCNLAESEVGQSLIQDLGSLTLTDVAASDDLTGHASLGGDWVLEFSVGQVESKIAVSAELQQEYQGTFATYTVTSLADSGAGSLREAITLANSSGGADTIEFGVAGTVSLSSALPTINEQLTIDGSTAPGYSGDPVVEIDGTGVSGNGLRFTSGADDSTVNALMITNFTGNGIQIDNGADGITITGNWIGTTGTGTTGDGNSNNGINVQGANTVIGGTGANDGNVITNNGNEGINLTGSGATGTIIQGNIIGLDPDGITGSGNGDVGIALLSGSHNTTIGGTDPNAGNIISMNFEGIEINSNNNTIQGNYIGTDITGTLDRGNRSDDGIEIKNNATGNLIGGTDPGAGNLIAFNALDGVNLVSGSSNTVLGNDIHSNGDQQIDLAAGANGDQAAPLLTSAQTNGSELTVSGSLSSTANSYFRIEFFGADQTYLGFVNVATDGSGNAAFETTLSASVASGTLITSSATKSDAAYSTFTDSSAFSATVVSGNAGTAIWAESGSNFPEYSEWDGTSFGTEGTAYPVGEWRIMQGAESPQRDEKIVIGVDASGNIEGMLWNGSSWSQISVGGSSIFGTVSASFWWGMDVQYESQSGDAVMVWNDGDNIEYATWDGTSWSSVGTISGFGGATPRQLQLATSPDSDEMVLVVSDSSSRDSVFVWDGTSWGSEQVLSTGGDDRTDIFVTYEQQSGHAMVTYSNNSADVKYRTWDGSSWSAEFNVNEPAGFSGTDYARWTTLASDPNSDRIALGVLTSGGDVWFNVWDGDAWSTSTAATTTSTGTTELAMAVAFESTSGELLATYGESGSSTVRYMTWSAGSGWSGEQNGPNIGGTPNSMTLSSDPLSDRVMLAVNDDNSDVNYVLWNGSTWGTVTEQETSSGETKNQPFLFLWDQHPGNQAPTDLVATSTTNSGVTLNADGGNDVYFVADDGGALLGGLTTVTIEASFAITSPVITYAPILSYADGSNDEELAILLEADGTIRFGASSNGSVLQDTAGIYTQLFDGSVHHVAVSWDSATGAVDFYVDGTLVESFSGYQTGQTITGTGELVFGQEQDSVLGNFSTSEVFSGTLYDIRIFDDVRTPGEIGANYDQTLPSTEAGMIANWVFDDLSVNGEITDTVSGNNLTQQQVVGAGFTTSVAELNLQVFENAANGTVVGNLATLDPDSGDSFTYSLQDDAGGRFAINPTNGEITVANGLLLDFETASSHDITVRTTDAGGLTYDEVFTITVTDVNDDPMITSDGGGATVAINVAENTTAVTTVTATDPDLQTPTFTITGGADQGLFSIDSFSGALTFDIAPDYEGAGDNLYEVEVTASDGIGGTDVQTISVRVTDVAEGIRVTPTSVVPLGDETLVNTETTDNQIIGANVSQAIATDANGNYVIAWASNLQDGSGWGVYAQLFNADGTPQGSEIQIHTTVADSQLNPTVAMDDAGNFVVAWQSENQDGSSYGVYTRSFDAAGNPTSTETLVNTETANYQGSPGIAMAPNGDYVVIWTSSGQDNPDGNSGIYAQLFNADGSTNGGEFLVNTYTLGHQQVSSVSMDDSGNFVVTWGSQNQDGSNYGVFTQLFDANGVTIGSEFQVNTTTDYSQLYNDVVMLPDGRFVVAFQSVNADTSTDLLIQRYESDGTPIGGEIKVNSVSDMNYFPIPSITADDSGNLTVVWNNSNDGTGNGVFMRRYDWDGNTLTGELQVNTTTAGDQTYPDVVTQPGGGFIVVWGGEGAGDTDGVFMQRYGLATDEDGGSTAFELVLESAPTSDVVIPISVSDGSEGSVSVGSITFTSGNWNIAQTVTVTGLQDFFADGDQVYTVIIGPATSADPNFNGLDPADLTITNIETNSPPQLTNGSNTSYGEGSGSTPFLTSTLTDINSADFDGGTLTFSIASGGDGTDVLRLGIMNGVTVSGNNVYVDGVLVGTQSGGTSGTDYTISLNSNSTPTRVETLFQNLIILGAGDNPATGVRNLEVTVTDGDGGTSNTATATADLTTVVNDPPVISVDPSPILYLSGTMNVDPNLTVSDVDNATLQSAQVWFGDGYLRGQDRLLFTDQLGITGSFDFNTGILTLTGSASVADYQTALRSVQYQDFNPTPAEGILYVNFSVSDGTDTSLVDTRVLEIVDNLPPRAADDFGTAAEGGSVVIDLAANDTDADDALDLTSIVITSGPANGSVVVNGDGTVTYTHDGSETASDTFTYTIKDTDGNLSNEAPVSITVTAVNDAPSVATNTGTTVNEGSTGTVITNLMLNEGDPDDSGADVTYTVTAIPDYGTLRLGGTALVVNSTFTQADIDAGDLTYDHDGSENFSDGFGFTLADGGEDGAAAASGTFSIGVTPVNDLPTIAGTDTGAVQEDVAVVANNISTTGTLTITDPDTGESTFQTATINGTYGDLTIDTAGNWTYTADNTQAAIQQLDVSESLTDTLTVTSFDGTTHNVVITINGSEDAAIIGGTTSGSVTEDGALTSSGPLTISDTDTSDSPSFADVTSIPGDNAYGSFVMTAGTWTYTLDNNHAAVQALDVSETLSDTHTFTATDGSTQQVTVTINGAEDTPTIDSTAVTAATEDTAYSYTITTSDVDVESVVITAPTLPGWLTLVDNGDGTATLSGTPTNAEVGSHNVVLNVSDGTLSSNQNFTIVVGNTNDPAVIGGVDTGAVTEDVAVVANDISTTGTLTIADPDTGESTFQAATINGTYGDLTIDTAGNWTYTADNTQAAIQQLDVTESLTDTLTVTSFDGTTHNVVVTINGSEDAAVITGTTTGSVTEDGTLTSSGALTISDTDTSDSPSFADVTSTPGDNAYGSFVMTAGTWTYTLDNNHAAVQALDVSETLSDTHTFTASDGSTQQITITINGAEDTPVFDSTAVTAATEDVAYSYTITTSDVDVESVTITAPTLPAWLTLVDNGDGTATLSGTPTNAEVGSHNVVLNVSDGTLSSNQSFTITVANTSDPAVIGGVDTGSVQEDVAVVANNISTSGTLTIADPDTGESTFQAATINGTYGDLTIDTAGNWTYTADNTQAAIQQLDVTESLTDTLTVTSFDGTPHNVVITINGSEDAAVISGTTTGSVIEDGTLTSSGALTITDTDTTDSPGFADVGATAGDNGYGSFEMTSGTWTYTLNNNHASVQALDAGETLSDMHTFTASDGSTQVVTVTINGAEDAPVFDSTAVTAATEDSAYSYSITTSDVDVESVTITAPTLPIWLTLVDNGDGTATLSGTPSNAEVGNHNVVLNVSDGTLSSNQNFTITVANTPDAAVIGGVDTGAVTEDVAVVANNISTTGTLTIADPDAGESTFQAGTVNGTYGDLTIDTAGNWSYTADNTQAAIQQLDVSEFLTDTLTVTSFDGTPHNVVITINGSEDTAVISGTTIGSVTEDGTITSSGALAITDTDTSDTPSFADVTSTAGDNGYGSFEMTAGTWTYTLNNAHPAVQALDVSETLTDTHTFTATDGSTQQVTVTINGAEDAPVFDSSAVTAATEDLAYSYTITTSDVDVESVTITAPTLPAWLTLVDNGDGTATLSGTPTNAEVGNHNVVLNVSDGTLNSNQNFTITVANTPDAAVIGGVDTGAVQEDVAVVANNISTTGTLTITDPDAGESTFQAGTVNGTYGDLTIDTAGNWSYTADNTQAAIQQLDVSESLTDTLTVTSFDGTTHNVVITINGSEDTAVISGTTIGSVTEDGTLTSSGALAIADTDTSDSPGFADVTSTAGDNGYGSFVMTAGTWTYTLDNNHAAVQALDVSETLTDTHTFTATDGSTQVVTVTINGAEDAPTLDNSIADQTATESVAFGYTFAANSFGDLDVSDSLTYSATLGDNSPLPAWLSFDGPTRTFSGTPGVGDTGAIDIKIIADDGSSTVTDIFTLTVDPQNSAPAVGGIDQAAVTEDRDLQSGDLSAEGALTIADPDAGQSSFVAQTINGSFGALTIDASGNWRYLADNANAEIQALQSGQSVNETLTVTTADGSTHQVVITINGTTEAPPAPPQVAGPPVEEPLPLEEIPSAEEEVKLGSIGGEDPILEEIVRIPQAAVLPTPTEQDHGVAQGDEPEAEAVNYGPVIDKRTAKIPELRPAQALQASNLSLDTLTLQVTDDEALNERYELELLSRIDRMHLGMDSEAARQAADDVEVQIVVGSTASLTVGIVSWVLRSGALLASLMSSVPLLNKFDPLPILKGRDDEEDVEPDEDEDTQTGDHARKVDNMFSGKGSEKQ